MKADDLNHLLDTPLPAPGSANPTKRVLNLPIWDDGKPSTMPFVLEGWPEDKIERLLRALRRACR